MIMFNAFNKLHLFNSCKWKCQCPQHVWEKYKSKWTSCAKKINRLKGHNLMQKMREKSWELRINLILTKRSEERGVEWVHEIYWCLHLSSAIAIESIFARMSHVSKCKREREKSLLFSAQLRVLWHIPFCILLWSIGGLIFHLLKTHTGLMVNHFFFSY